ncbi:MAG: hypothetical protein IK031_04325 [Bacteroidales bacterium]|nr:hypothetical protein [Bacteroidales bacterium]
MEENFDALEVIARTRGKVEMDVIPSGRKLFPLWGSITAFFYALEFVLLKLTGSEWCLWLWVGIPLIGIPLMVAILRKDRERLHMRSRGSKLVLDYWIFAACAICLGGFIFGFFDLYESVENPLICLLVGIGAFVTGETVRFRPMVIGGLVGASIGFLSFLLQAELWAWQTLAVALCAIVALIIPGCLFEKRIKDGVQ